MGRKMLAVHKDEPEFDLWEQAKKSVERDVPSDNPREGEVLGELAAAYIGTDGPLGEVDDGE